MKVHFGLFILSILVFECEETNTNVKTVYRVNGDWTGVTSQNMEIFFSVKSQTIDTLGVKFRVTGPTCIYDPIDPVIFSSIKININHFEASDTNTFVAISGDFTSDNSAKGTVLVTHFCGTLNATWDAAKN